MPEQARRAIVVGVDGSPAGHAAVRWAANEAARHDRPLQVVHGYAWPNATELIWPPGHAFADYVDRANGLVAEATAAATAASPGVVVSGDARAGDATEMLLNASRRAALVVVGARGKNALTGVLIGSVSQAVASRAHCPVAVVHGMPAVASGPVLVGTDSSVAADLALGAAFDEAATSGCTVLAVRAWTPPGRPWRSDVRSLADDIEEIEAAERRALEDAVRPWREKYPAVPVELRIVPNSAGDALLAIGQEARLTVVGTRGRGAVAGLVLGSVSQYVLRHASGPVLIARPTSDHRPGCAPGS